MQRLDFSSFFPLRVIASRSRSWGWKTGFIILTGTIGVATWQAHADTNTWAGLSTENLNWSNPANWSLGVVPTINDTVVFGDSGGFTNAQGLVNNIVDSNITISNLVCSARSNSVVLFNDFHTTQINTGVTLTTSNLTVGDVDTDLVDPGFYYTVIGSGGSLNVGDTNSPTFGFQVTSGKRDAPATNHVSFLDLSGLDNFNVGASNFWVGCLLNGVAPGATSDRPAGIALLAKTNRIVLFANPTDNSSARAPFGIADAGNLSINTLQRPSYVELGQENAIYTAMIKVGGSRSKSDLGGAFMYFRPGLINPTLKLRGADDATRMGTLYIGDNFGLTAASAFGAEGTLDLTGGTVDALITQLTVGRGGAPTSGTGNVLGSGKGTLIWNSGIFDVTTFIVGLQSVNRANSATGVVSVVSSNAKLIVRGDADLGRDLGNSVGTGDATLNIDGGTVEIFGRIQELQTVTAGVTYSPSSTIILTNNGLLNLQPAGDPDPSPATFDTLNYSSGSVTNGILAPTVINVFSPATEFTVNAGTELRPAALTTVKTLTVNGGLKLRGTTAMYLNRTNTPNSSQIVVNGTLDCGGTLQLTNLGAALVEGDSFQLFTATSVVNPFTDMAITYPALDPGLGWTNRLGIDGTIQVISSVNTTPTPITALISGNQIDLSWPSDRTGWRLEAQSNSLSVGISNNWATVTGSETTNHFTITVDPANGAAFYRLVYP